ncbi:MAG TPA: Dyp-type peroxidase [Burkholderiaceae bacterium]
MAARELELDDIQGNIIGGFNKDYQDFVVLKFRSGPAARAWIQELADESNEFGVAVSSSEAVLRFNAQFKALKSEGKEPERFIEAEWTSLSISYAGMQALGIAAADLAKFPDEFKAGMAARKAVLNDVGSSDPSKWVAPFNAPGTVHALLTVAADSEARLKLRLAEIRATGAFVAGVESLLLVEGRTRKDARGQTGHEHFGFKDGVSQPGIRGINPPDDPIANPNQGHPGQDLLHPGEFVLGYPTQIPIVDPDVDGPNPNPGPNSASGPAWTDNGSYLVFRRLAQDVPAFHSQVAALAAAHGMHPDLVGAKLVGRYQSGCPLEARAFQPSPFHVSSTDPERFQPGVADSDALNNNFEFGDDLLGQVCPMASHIRKAYPRDEPTPAAPNSEPETQTHRLLRRGIPFGRSFGAPVGGDAGDPRGLVFQCYQKSIANQFEFVQQSWVNNASFPPGANGGVPGEDPIIAQSVSGPFQLDPSKPNIAVKHFVTTTGGEYFLTPSISTLQKIGSGAI